MTSLYAQYVKERQGLGIVETDYGFATFDYVTDTMVYIIDLYVVPEKRKEGLASKLADAICDSARIDGKTHLLGSVDVTARGAETSAKILKAYGMQEYKVDGTMVFYIKEIGV